MPQNRAKMNTTTTKTSRYSPEFMEYILEADRLKSFKTWPKQMKQKPIELSDAGFFYTHSSDRVICFCCGGGLNHWEKEDDPWEQHALWFGNCDYVRIMKSKEFISMVEKKFENFLNKNNIDIQQNARNSNDINNSIASLSLSDENPAKTVDETRLCKICWINEYNTVFIPCAHVVACAKCASTQLKCPICRTSVQRIMQIFFS